MTQKALTIPSIVGDRLVRGRVAADMLLVVAASVIIALAAQVAIPLPFTPVPLTLQPLAVILVGAALGSTRAAVAATLYLLEGASGLPVFAQGHGGAIWLSGFTAGYLFSYPFAAWLAGFFSERGWGNSIVRSVTGMIAAQIVIFLGGWSWLAVLTNPQYAYAAGVAPFLVADLVKVAFGASLLPYVQRIVAKTNVES